MRALILVASEQAVGGVTCCQSAPAVLRSSASSAWLQASWKRSSAVSWPSIVPELVLRFSLAWRLSDLFASISVFWHHLNAES